MEEVIIDDEEMINYILKKAKEDTGRTLSYGDVELVLNTQIDFYEVKGLIEDDELQEITVSTDDDEVIASISLTEGNGIVKNGYKITGFDKQERGEWNV